MTTVNLREAKTHLSRSIERVESGERIVIARAGKPVAGLGPLRRKGIELGGLRGRWQVDDDAFVAADAEVLRMFDDDLVAHGMVELPFTSAHAAAIDAFPGLAGTDPFDRALLAQAGAERSRFLTADRRLLGLGRPWIPDARR